METEKTVSYNDLRDSHRRLVNALREAKEREALLNERIHFLTERIHFLTVTLGEQQIGVFPCSPDMADA
jgi:signal transduction histidine kinase